MVSSIAALPAVVRAVDGACPVLLDGGVRRGTDVIKAMCLGTTACLIARPFLYALAADGEHGVSDLLRIPRAEIQTSLSLMGCASLAERDEFVARTRGLAVESPAQ
jgi:isopentenyl diphosphate isomerase/L-lactate dehydrogenase-like FMN-dependent dehydrogenase